MEDHRRRHRHGRWSKRRQAFDKGVFEFEPEIFCLTPLAGTSTDAEIFFVNLAADPFRAVATSVVPILGITATGGVAGIDGK